MTVARSRGHGYGMSFLVALLIWVLILGLCFSLAIYAIRQFPATEPFRGIAIVILCIIAIVVLLGFVTGQIPMIGYARMR